LVWDIKGETKTENAREQGAEENIRKRERWSERKLEKAA
jgi:hypothetical protein